MLKTSAGGAMMTRARAAWIMIGLFAATVAGAEGQLCFKIGEHTEGDKKVCIYQCRMKQATVTVAASQTCPTSVRH
jgi:hypothetical protein